jgi:hypothetical protein
VNLLRSIDESQAQAEAQAQRMKKEESYHCRKCGRLSLVETRCLFYFQDQLNVTFEIDTQSTIEDIQIIISDFVHIFSPPFVFHDDENNELDLHYGLSECQHEITIFCETKSKHFAVIMPNGSLQFFARKRISNLRQEICEQLHCEIDLISCGQLLEDEDEGGGEDDRDVGDSAIFVCVRPSVEESSFTPRLRYNFEIEGTGFMMFEPTSSISIEYTTRMFSYISESQSVRVSQNGRVIETGEILPSKFDSLLVEYHQESH